MKDKIPEITEIMKKLDKMRDEAPQIPISKRASRLVSITNFLFPYFLQNSFISSKEYTSGYTFRIFIESTTPSLFTSKSFNSLSLSNAN